MQRIPVKTAGTHVLTALLLALATMPRSVSAQHASSTSSGSGGLPTAGADARSGRSYSPFNASPPDTDPLVESSRERARATERQKRMVEDANRLVVLTKQYRDNVAQQRGSTPEDSKLLLDIQKLARSVKDRMRGQ